MQQQQYLKTVNEFMAKFDNMVQTKYLDSQQGFPSEKSGVDSYQSSNGHFNLKPKAPFFKNDTEREEHYR